MGTNYPPDGFVVEGGDSVWGTDVKDSFAQYKTGNQSVEFADTTPSADPIYRDEEYYLCAVGELFRVGAWFRASRRDGGDQVRLIVDWYTNAEVYISSSTVYDAILDAINTWEHKAAVVTAPANAVYFRYYAGKDNTAFTAWVDAIEVHTMPPSFWAYLDADTAYATNDTIVFDVADGTGPSYNYGGNYNAATGLFTALEGGLYSFVAMAIVSQADIDTGETCIIYLVHGTLGTIAKGTLNWAIHGDNEGDRTFASSGPIWLDAGETMRVLFIETHAAGDVTVLGDVAGIPNSYFTGAKVG